MADTVSPYTDAQVAADPQAALAGDAHQLTDDQFAAAAAGRLSAAQQAWCAAAAVDGAAAAGPFPAADSGLLQRAFQHVRGPGQGRRAGSRGR